MLMHQLPFEHIVLASQSPRRLALMQQLGLFPQVLPINVDETHLAKELPLPYVQRVSFNKATAALTKIGKPNVLVIAADTTVVFGEKILGKPKNNAQAIEIIDQLQGRCHEVITAVCCAFQGQIHQTHCVSQVWFRAMSPAEVITYCQSNEPYDKAGAYAIQGVAAQFIERIEGSYSGIMGLPLYELSALLKTMALTR